MSRYLGPSLTENILIKSGGRDVIFSKGSSSNKKFYCIAGCSFRGPRVHNVRTHLISCHHWTDEQANEYQETAKTVLGRKLSCVFCEFLADNQEDLVTHTRGMHSTQPGEYQLNVNSFPNEKQYQVWLKERLSATDTAIRLRYARCETKKLFNCNRVGEVKQIEKMKKKLAKGEVITRTEHSCTAFLKKEITADEIIVRSCFDHTHKINYDLLKAPKSQLMELAEHDGAGEESEDEIKQEEPYDYDDLYEDEEKTLVKSEIDETIKVETIDDEYENTNVVSSSTPSVGCLMEPKSISVQEALKMKDLCKEFTHQINEHVEDLFKFKRWQELRVFSNHLQTTSRNLFSPAVSNSRTTSVKRKKPMTLTAKRKSSRRK